MRRRIEAEFTPDVGSPASARRFVRDALGATELPVDLIVLLVSELATNAVLHARTDFIVRLDVDDVRHRVRVEVEDANERTPAIAHTPQEATSGRGLQLVQAVADAWGVQGRDDGKLVWFEMAADGAVDLDLRANHANTRQSTLAR